MCFTSTIFIFHILKSAFSFVFQLSLLLSELSFLTFSLFFHYVLYQCRVNYLPIPALSHSGLEPIPACPIGRSTPPFLFVVRPLTVTNCAVHYCTQEKIMIMYFLFLCLGRVICTPASNLQPLPSSSPCYLNL